MASCVVEQKLGYEMPTRETIIDQIQLAQSSMFLYAALPVFSEWLIEKGWTLCYYDLEQVGGWPAYVGLTLLYLALVEIGVSGWLYDACSCKTMLESSVGWICVA